MKSKLHQDLYKKLAIKFQMSPADIERICDSQFEFTKEIMSNGDDEPIRLQYLGLFSVKPGRRETVRKRKERMKEIRKQKKNDTK